MADCASIPTWVMVPLTWVTKREHARNAIALTDPAAKARSIQLGTWRSEKTSCGE
jgi:hypothetical protein